MLVIHGVSSLFVIVRKLRAFGLGRITCSESEARAETNLEVVLCVSAKERRGIVNLNHANEKVLGDIHVQRAAEFHRKRIVGGTDRTDSGTEMRDAK